MLTSALLEQKCDELKESIKKEREYYTRRIVYLEKKVDELSDPLIKDKEIARLTKEKDEARADLRRGFGITKEQEHNINRWWEKHRIEKHNGKFYTGTSGGGLVYHFYPCAIGCAGVVECSCGERFEFLNDF